MRTTTSPTRARVRSIIAAGIALLAVPVIAAGAFAAAGGQSELAAIREATARFHDVSVAEAEGYGRIYLCTDENSGAGAMGWHYANGAYVDPVNSPGLDLRTPEVLVYEPKPGGGLRLVGVEYVTFQAAWHDAFGAAKPSVLGRDLKAMDETNRYGLPPFYQIHVWAWKPNPSGLFNDWNPRVSCLGEGDPA
jgi:hypothetical protein